MKKKFDCIAMKRKIQTKIYEETKNLTDEELSTYYKNSVETGPLAHWWKKVKAAQEQQKKTAG